MLRWGSRGGARLATLSFSVFFNGAKRLAGAKLPTPNSQPQCPKAERTFNIAST
jgi:hypothetical protein